MAQVFKYVQGDTAPQIKVTLTEEDTGEPVDLAGATVTLHFRLAGQSQVIFSREFYVNPELTHTGVAILNWQSGDLDIAAGAYEGEVEVVRSTGTRETLYDKLQFKIRSDLA